MARIIEEVSHTFSEYLLVPNLTKKDDIPSNVSLKTPLVKFKQGESPSITLNVPFLSAVMQSVSNDTLAVALARSGGLSFIYCSQPIEEQALMISKVKKYKAGFVVSDSNLKPDSLLVDVVNLKEKTGHSTIAITDDGTSSGKLIGIVTSRDYRVNKISLSTKVTDFMTPISSIIFGNEGITLTEANDLIWNHKENPNELLDKNKRLMVGAGINTKDYKERVPALIQAGADIFCIDSSDGFSEWQKEAIEYIKSNFGEHIKVGAGNVVGTDAFNYLADAGADFVKVGIGGGSICITREQKGIGRGQASAIIDVAEARDKYFKEKKVYIPICSDGGIVHDYHVTLALAMGADFVMMGRYFARFDESPTKKLKIGNNYVKEYWAEGSFRARNWQRYDLGGEGQKLSFEEGVDSYVPYAGKLKDNLGLTINKIKSTMCNCGCKTIEELHNNARLTLVSSTSIIEGGAHNVILKNREESNNT